MNAIKPKKYIKNSQKLENIQCKICYEVSEKPYSCQGPCGIVLCQNCIVLIKKNYGECPQRCSKPLSVQPCPNVHIEFVCPFNSLLCSQTFSSLQLFKFHLQKCQYSAQLLNTIQNLNKYRCSRGHDLYFLTEDDLIYLYGVSIFDIDQTENSFCQNCKDVTLCRSICPQCSTKQKLLLFCCKCCKPPCTKTSCLHQHNLVKQQINSSTTICDYCAKPFRLYGSHGYKDKYCNFDICQSCYELLPEKHARVPQKMQISCIRHLNHINLQYDLDESEQQQPAQQEELLQLLDSPPQEDDMFFPQQLNEFDLVEEEDF